MSLTEKYNPFFPGSSRFTRSPLDFEDSFETEKLIKEIKNLFKSEYLNNNYFSSLDSSTGVSFLNAYLNENEVFIEVSVPGFSKEDIDVRYSKDILSISANKKPNQQNKDSKKFICKEFTNKGFNRRLRFRPGFIDPSSIKADLVDGILKIRINMAKSKQEEPVTIKIN